MGDIESFKIVVDLAGGRCMAGQHVTEQMVVKEYGGKQLPVVVTAVCRDGIAVEQHLAALWFIDAEEKLDQRRLAAAILADDEENFATLDLEVDRTEFERNSPARPGTHSAHP